MLLFKYKSQEYLGKRALTHVAGISEKTIQKNTAKKEKGSFYWFGESIEFQND